MNEISSPESSNFHMALMFLPKAKRNAMFDFYRFCRQADDIVDEMGPHSKENAQKSLQVLQKEVENSFNGSPTTPLGEKIKHLVKTYPIKKEYLLKILEGCEMDLNKNRYETFSDLYDYCYRVASAVGLVSIAIFGCSLPQSKDYAINLGVAFQLTNILRDLKEDKERGRIYIPMEDLYRFGYPEKMLLEGVSNESFRKLMEFECQRAETYYQNAHKNLKNEDKRSLIPAQIMRSVYHQILNKINRDPEIVLKKRIGISKPKKLYLAFRSLINCL